MKLIAVLRTSHHSCSTVFPWAIWIPQLTRGEIRVLFLFPWLPLDLKVYVPIQQLSIILCRSHKYCRLKNFILCVLRPLLPPDRLNQCRFCTLPSFCKSLLFPNMLIENTNLQYFILLTGARNVYHQLFMSSLLMDLKYKKLFAIHFARVSIFLTKSH